MNKFVFLFLFITGFITAQNPTSNNYNTKNSSVTYNDLKATSFPDDSIAHAFYIYENGFSKIDREHEYNLLTHYSAKIKILDKEGLDHANIEIPLRKSSKNTEEIENLKASTFKYENGKILKRSLEPEKVYTEDFERYELKKFTFRDVAPGDVIVYSYDLISPFLFDFKTWYFQEDIPKLYSEFTAQIPGNYEYYITIVGNEKLKSSDSKIIKDCVDFGGNSEAAGCVETKFVMEDIPAFKKEDYMTSSKNFISHIKFELKEVTRLDGGVKKYTKTWHDVDMEIKSGKGLGHQWKKDRLVDDVLPEEITALPNNLEKARKIYHYVQKNYKWNGDYELYRDMNIKDILDTHSGNLLSINTLLHNIYSSEGFEVYPVMASTRENGFPTKLHPVLSDFNYFFVQLNLDGKYYNLDASGENLDFGRLPFRALNGYARKIDFENGSSWINIDPEDFSSITYQDSLKVNADGTSEGHSEQVLTGYHALNFRNYRKDNSDDEVFNKVSKPNDYTVATKTEYENLDDNESKLHIRYDLKNKSQKINDLIYLNPFSFQFFKENPFNLDKRTYPIDFGYKDSYLYSAIIEIPEGYTVSDLPEQKAIRIPNNGGSLLFVARQIPGNVVNVQCRLTFPQSVYPSGYYEAIKKFFNEVLEVQKNSVIVLKEKA